MNTDEAQRAFFQTARTRYSILLRKRANEPYEVDDSGGCWSDDVILNTFRFCNVFREDDRVTAWFRDNIRAHIDHELPGNKKAHVQAAVAFRWFNLPETGYLMRPWLLGDEGILDAEHRVAARAAEGHNILNAAYMIKSPPGMKKTAGLFQCIRAVVAELDGLTSDIVEAGTLERAVELLQQFPYLGPFMAYQMVCDLRYTCVLEHAPDVNYWTAPGPGSARGIGRIFHNDPDAYNYNSARDKPVIVDKMRYLLELSRDPAMWPKTSPRWELSTVQHWACEFDKYMRAFLGEGTPKQRYRPAT